MSLTKGFCEDFEFSFSLDITRKERAIFPLFRNILNIISGVKSHIQFVKCGRLIDFSSIL